MAKGAAVREAGEWWQERGRPESLRALGLSEREMQVVKLVVPGLTNAQIAAELRVSTLTVKKHLENVYAKLGVGGRGPLTALVLGIARPEALVAVPA